MRIQRPLVFAPLLTALFVAPALAQAEGQKPPDKPVDWKDLTRSGLPIKFYGFLRLDAYYNTARANSVVIPQQVLPETTKRNDDQFYLDPRLTRFGVDVMPVEVGGSKVGGKLEIDFANFPTGSTESRATPRIRLAYLDVAQDDLGFRAGQDWDVISPLFPAANHEFLMWNAGNLGDRRAQLQGRYAPKDSSIDLKAALGLTGAVNGQDLDTGASAGLQDGFDSGMPHLQVRGGWKGDLLVEKKPTELGIWGAVGQTQTDQFFNGENRFDAWCAGGDFQVPVCASVTFRGEAWTGVNLGDFRGGIGQTVNTTLGNEVSSTGGWAEFVYAHTAKTKFHLGGTIDDPENEDLNAGNPNRNLAGYIGTVVDWDNGVRTGFDTLYWETEYQGGTSGNMVRFDLYFQYSF
jgi:hypothetical protein